MKKRDWIEGILMAIAAGAAMIVLAGYIVAWIAARTV